MSSLYSKAIPLIFLLLLFSSPLQTNEIDLDDVCRFDPFAVGCKVSSFGPVISVDKDRNLLLGAGGSIGYFIFRRVSASVGGSVMFSKGYDSYTLGPDLRVHLGTFGAAIFQLGYVYNRLWVTGDYSAAGWSYGPSLSALLPAGGRVYLGITIGYYSYRWGTYSYSQWDYAPALALYF